MSDIDNKNYYSIRHIAAQTGVNPVTLRAWERRYGLIRPERTPKGHRLYTQQDIRLVKNILFILNKGYAISKVKALLENEQLHLLEPNNYESLMPCFKAISQALENLNAIQLDNQLSSLYTLYSPEQFGDDILPRLLSYLNEHYFTQTKGAIAQRTFLFDLLNNKLYQYLYQNKHKNDKQAYFLIGYRTAMIQTRILSGLLLASSIKTYEHSVNFISGLSSHEEILGIAARNPQQKIIVFTNPDIFYVQQLLLTLEENAQDNILLFTGQIGRTKPQEIKNQYLLPQKYSEIYGALNN